MPFVPDSSQGYFVPDENSGEGSVMSFIRAAGNQMPLGAQFAALVSPGKYSENMAAQNAAIAQDKTTHPIAYGAGAVSGAVAPTLIPGVGPLMAANPMTAGAMIGGTNAIANTDITKNPVEAAAQFGNGASMGALTSGTIAKYMPMAKVPLEEKANKLANKSINMPTGVLGEMTPEEQQAQGMFLRDTGLVGADKEKVLSKARNLLNDYGQSIGSIGQGMIKKGLTVEDSGMLTQPLVDKAEKFALLEDPEANLLYKTYMAGAKAIASKGENPSWSDLQSLKETYGPLAFKSTGEIKNQAAADIYHTLSGALKDIADKASTNLEIASEYRQALSGYSRMSPIVSGMEKSVDSELRGSGGHGGHGIIGLIKSMPGPLRAVIGAASTAAGHPHYALAAALPELVNPAIQSNVVSGISKALPEIQNLATQATTRASTNPEVQSKISDLIKNLISKYDSRRQF